MPATRYGVSPWVHAFPSSKRPNFPVYKGAAAWPVVIVGGGMAGVMSAYACAVSGMKVVLLEADRLGSGGSGRASGIFRSEAVPSFRDLEAHAGRRAARAHFDLTRRAALELVSTVRRLGIRADVESRDAVRLVPPGWTAKGLQKEIEARRGADIQASWQSAAVMARGVAVESAGGGKLPAWGQCDPYRLVLGFAAAAVKRGAEVFERTAVGKITFDRKVATVITAQGKITASKVLVCTGEPTGLVKALRRHFRFEEQGVVLTDPMPAPVRKQVGPRSSIVCDVEIPPHAVRWTSDHRAMVTGADQPRTPERGREKVDIQRTGQLMYELTRLYPAISGIQPAFGWSLPQAASADGALCAGPHRNFPHQLFALSTAHDPARAFLASRILLRHLVGENTSEDEHFGFARNLEARD